MRQVRYSVAMSLDAYIAGPSGEADWIVMDPEFNFSAIFNRFDTLLIGRKTFLAMQEMGGGVAMPGVESVVLSRTLRESDHPGVTIVNDATPFVRDLKQKPGKDIWLFGGGELFQNLLNDGIVDGIDVGVMPVLLGGGIPFLPTPAKKTKLVLRNHRIYGKSGMASLPGLKSNPVPGSPRGHRVVMGSVSRRSSTSCALTLSISRCRAIREIGSTGAASRFGPANRRTSRS